MYKHNFIDACLEGEALPQQIDDYIDAWHNSDTREPIYRFLGMTEDEYSLWVENDLFLKHILFARKKKIPFNELIAWDDGKKLAARASSRDEAQAILDWLKRTGRI
jgi:hypothetical protein